MKINNLKGPTIKNKMQYYYVAYGHVIRISEKCSSRAEAMQYCYGLVAPDRMSTYPIGTRSPRYLSQKVRAEMIAKLEVFHANKIKKLEEALNS